MKTHKCTIYVMILLCLGAFAAALLLDIYVCNKFWSNVFLGVFASGLVALISSIVMYKRTKREAVFLYSEKVFRFTTKVSHMPSRIEFCDYDWRKIYDIVVEVSEYWQEASLSSGNICFFTRYNKVNKIIVAISELVTKFYQDICPDLENLLWAIDQEKRYKSGRSQFAQNENRKMRADDIKEFKNILKIYNVDYRSFDVTVMKLWHELNHMMKFPSKSI